MKRILVITPICRPDDGDEADAPERDPDSAWVCRTYLSSAPPAIESEHDIALAAAAVAERAKDAEEQGYDAVVIDCFADPGLPAARELLSIPVCGAGETSMWVAAGLAGKFSVITVLPGLIPIIEGGVRKMGISGNLASVRSIDVPVRALRETDLVSPLLFASAAAVSADGAAAVVLGCTGLTGVADALQKQLAEREGSYIPVVDASCVPVLYAAFLAKSRLRHSEKWYPSPPRAGERD